MNAKPWILAALAALASGAGARARAEAAADVFLLDAGGEAVCRLDGVQIRMHQFDVDWADRAGRLGDEPAAGWLPVCDREDFSHAMEEEPILLGMAAPVGASGSSLSTWAVASMSGAGVLGCWRAVAGTQIDQDHVSLFGIGVTTGSLAVISTLNRGFGFGIGASMALGIGGAVMLGIGYRTCGGEPIVP